MVRCERGKTDAGTIDRPQKWGIDNYDDDDDDEEEEHLDGEEDDGVITSECF